MAETDEDILEIVGDCRRKFYLFMGHRVRSVNQKRAIDKIKRETKERCQEGKGGDEALVVIDFKMKFEATYFREKTVDHYGKRGISWHGALIQYFTYDVVARQAVLQREYFDDIIFSDNKHILLRFTNMSFVRQTLRNN